jgi:hypothetical protein
MQACPQGSVPPDAIKVIEKDAPGPFPNAETAGSGTCNPCMARLVSTTKTSGGTPLRRVVPSEAKIGLRARDKGSQLNAAARVTPRRSAKEQITGHKKKLKRSFIHNLALLSWPEDSDNLS